MMTKAIILVNNGRERSLFSIYSDGYPENIGVILDLVFTIEALKSNPKPGRITSLPEQLDWASSSLQIDCYYVYLVDFPTQTIHGWASGFSHWAPQETVSRLMNLTRSRYAIWKTRLPEVLPIGWKFVPGEHDDQKRFPVIMPFANEWDIFWSQLKNFSSRQMDNEELCENLQKILPVPYIPIERTNPLARVFPKIKLNGYNRFGFRSEHKTGDQLIPFTLLSDDDWISFRQKAWFLEEYSLTSPKVYW